MDTADILGSGLRRTHQGHDNDGYDATDCCHTSVLQELVVEWAVDWNRNRQTPESRCPVWADERRVNLPRKCKFEPRGEAPSSENCNSAVPATSQPSFLFVALT